MKEATTRRNLIAGELAAGRNPADLLRQMLEPRIYTALSDRGKAFLASRIDVAPSTVAGHSAALVWIDKTIGTLEPTTVRLADVQELVGKMADKLDAQTIAQYMSTLRQLLDFCDVVPNIA